MEATSTTTRGRNASAGRRRGSAAGVRHDPERLEPPTQRTPAKESANASSARPTPTSRTSAESSAQRPPSGTRTTDATRRPAKGCSETNSPARWCSVAVAASSKSSDDVARTRVSSKAPSISTRTAASRAKSLVASTQRCAAPATSTGVLRGRGAATWNFATSTSASSTTRSDGTSRTTSAVFVFPAVPSREMSKTLRSSLRT
mmetsp:Transcript_18379/g.73435  ORF Transcript_18379/g.73435 Transcript_18379/m.73435 type:complete len:203 (-) Transcript_18379:2945-3553(-)